MPTLHDDVRRDHDLEQEALVRLSAARDLVEHVLVGDVRPQPWTAAARKLIEQAEWLLQVAA